jgi:hypothetical protein
MKERWNEEQKIKIKIWFNVYFHLMVGISSKWQNFIIATVGLGPQGLQIGLLFLPWDQVRAIKKRID